MHKEDTTPAIGWHVLILPMMEETALYQWIQPTPDGGAKHYAGYVIPDVYLCPSAEPPTAATDDVESANYVGVAGAGTSRVPWPIEEGLDGHVFTDGLLPWGVSVKAGDVTDGASNTLAIGERTFFNRSEDWTFGGAWFDYGRQGEPTSIIVGATKNVVWPINTIENRRAFYIRDRSVPSTERKILNNDIPFGSWHPGGAHFGLADASVHFLDESINLNVLQDLASRNGGEVNRWEP